MIDKICFKNYKAFSFGELKIRPITVLLGANNVGKSSIMQLLLTLQQTSLEDENYKSALKLYGGYVDMGNGLNLIKNCDKTKKLQISIECEFSNIIDEFQKSIVFLL